MSSPTQRTIAELKKRGYQLVQVVEKWNQFARVRQDLFGIVDVLAVRVRPDFVDGSATVLLDVDHVETLGVQCTSGDHVAERVDKITNSDALHILKLAGWSIAVWGWRKNAKGRYVLREVPLA